MIASTPPVSPAQLLADTILVTRKEMTEVVIDCGKAAQCFAIGAVNSLCSQLVGRHGRGYV